MRIRKARHADALMVLDWRNDPMTRAMSRNGEAVSAEEHLAWFGRAVEDPERLLFIGEADAGAVGMVRFDLGEPCEVSINLNPAFRGQGLSRDLLAAALQACPVRPLEAEIKEENAPSQRLFEGAGFVRLADRAGLRRYRLG